MRHALFVALALFAATSAKALKPTTETFLTDLGFDPKSAQITAIAGDSITTKAGVVKSLDSLADKHDEDGIRRFVATRNFVKAYMKDTKTPFPEDDLYEANFLKTAEVTFILNSLKQPFKLA